MVRILIDGWHWWSFVKAFSRGASPLSPLFKFNRPCQWWWWEGIDIPFWHEKVGWIFATLSQIQVYWRCPFMMFNWTLRKKYIWISQLQKDGDYRIVIFPTSQTKLRMEERFFLFIHRCLLARSLSTHIYRFLQFLQLPPSSEVPLYTYFYRFLKEPLAPHPAKVPILTG